MGEQKKLEFPLLRTFCDVVRNSPDPEWLLDKLVPADGLTLISGPPKRSFKTWMSKAIGIAVSSGAQVGPLQPTEKNKDGLGVLMLSQEGASKPSGRRFDMLMGGAKLSIEKNDKFYFGHRAPIYIDDEQHVAQLLDFCMDKDIKLLILDPFARLFRGDENSSQAVGAALRGIQAINNEKIAVILAHHVAKPGGKPEKDMDDSLRGSSAIAGAYDAHLALRVTDGAVWINLHTRYKEDEERDYKVVWNIDREKLLATLQMQLVDDDAVDELTIEFMKSLLVPGILYTENKLKKMWDCSPTAAQTVIAGLVENNTLKLVNPGKWVFNYTEESEDE